MKSLKRTVAVVLVVLSMLSVMAVSASAANTGDTEISDFTAPVIGYSEMKDDFARQKYDYSGTYLYLESTSNGSVRVKVLGATAQDGSYANETYANGVDVDYVTCVKGPRYVIHNMAKERGRDWVKLAFRSPHMTANVISGWWSPDCTNNPNYTDATP